MARFHNIDPLAEEFNYQSPYNFSENRVIDAIELEGLEKISVHIAGVYKTKNYSGKVVVSATVDIGNNNSTNFYVSNTNSHSITGEYSKEKGLQIDTVNGTDSKKNSSIIFNIAYPKGMKVPDFLAKFGIGKAIDDINPKNIEEALSLSESEVEQNQLITGILGDLKTLIDQDILEAYVDFTSSTEVTTDENGNKKERKFSNTYKGKVSNITVDKNGIYFQGSLLISFTQEKNNENDEEK